MPIVAIDSLAACVLSVLELGPDDGPGAPELASWQEWLAERNLQLVRTVETIGYGAALPRTAADVTQTGEPEDALRTVRRRLAGAVVLTAPLRLLQPDPIHRAPEAFAAWTAAQLPKWEALVRTAQIRPE